MIEYPLTSAHSYTSEETARRLQADIKSGLTIQEATNRNHQLGFNAYQIRKGPSALKILIDQFKNPMVYLLFVGSAVSFYFKDNTEGFAILGVIIINAIIGFIMEFQARKSMEALKQMDVPAAKVIRNGKLEEISSELLTAGDILFIEAGDIIPADARVFEAKQLQVDESALTGESLPVEKNAEVVDTATPLAERTNMLYKGTSVIKGNGKAVVTGIAVNTELGQITALVENAGESSTPLDKKLERLTRVLIWITLVITAIFIISGFIQGKKIHQIIETAIALAVAAIPEGLPIVATIALAYGMMEMARRNAIVKKLSSVETLGGTTLILTDKTGTLTENRITAVKFHIPFLTKEVNHSTDKKAIKNDLEKIIISGVLCNNAVISKNNGEEKETGDPLETGLLRFADALDYNIAAIHSEYPRINEFPFSSETKVMITVHKHSSEYYSAGKGSVEELLRRCSHININGKSEPLTDTYRDKILNEAETMSAEGLRVIGFSYGISSTSPEEFSKTMTFAGMIGFIDPPREDIFGAMHACKTAGIKVVMATGDHPKTASTIAKQIGMTEDGQVVAVSGAQFSDGIDASDEQKILEASVFARVSPKQMDIYLL
jgi:Ca2+-transporting ATPase